MADLEIGEVIESHDSPRGVTPGVTQELCRNHRYIPIHPSHTYAVASYPTNGAGNMGAMIITSPIKYAVVIIKEVPTSDIINIAVSIIINAVNNIKGIQPSVCRKIRMIVIKPLVNNANKDRFRSSETLVPGQLRLAPENIARARRPHRRG
ncbi:MAG: hypothetical protein ACKO45_16070 [Cyanobium sp.]